MATTERRPPLWLHPLGWLLAIWAASVVALGLAALVLRYLMAVVGLMR